LHRSLQRGGTWYPAAEVARHCGATPLTWNMHVCSKLWAGEQAATGSAPVLIVYTGGTTGRPKGAVLTQVAPLINGVTSHHMHAMTASDHVLTVLPFFHAGGLDLRSIRHK
jgi:long-subunit acyl-CoA synthetase (AMP-forming)